MVMIASGRFMGFALFLVCAEQALAQAAVPPAPKPSFSMSVRLKDGQVKPGSEIMVNIDLTNTSDAQTELWHAISGPTPYKVLVLDHAGKAVRLTPMGIAFGKGAAGWREKGENGEEVVHMVPTNGAPFRIAPGGVAKDALDIQDLFDFSQPGTYTIRLERIDPATKLLVKSNTVTLTIAN